MKKQFLFSLLLFIFIFFTPIMILSSETVRITWGEWPPYHSEKLPHGGVYTHIISEVFEAVGVDVEYGIFPWLRAFNLAKEAVWDGTAGWTKTEEREKSFIYSDSLAEGSVVFFYRKDNPFDWRTEIDLAGYTIGATLGYRTETILKDMQNNGISINLEIASQDLFSFKKLVSGRIDAFTCNKDVGLALLRDNFSKEVVENITYHELPLFSDTYHVLFSIKSGDRIKEIVELFNKGLKELKENGKYNQIIDDFHNGKYTIEN